LDSYVNLSEWIQSLEKHSRSFLIRIPVHAHLWFSVLLFFSAYTIKQMKYSVINADSS